MSEYSFNMLPTRTKENPRLFDEGVHSIYINISLHKHHYLHQLLIITPMTDHNPDNDNTGCHLLLAIGYINRYLFISIKPQRQLSLTLPLCLAVVSLFHTHARSR